MRSIIKKSDVVRHTLKKFRLPMCYSGFSKITITFAFCSFAKYLALSLHPSQDKPIADLVKSSMSFPEWILRCFQP